MTRFQSVRPLAYVLTLVALFASAIIFVANTTAPAPDVPLAGRYVILRNASGAVVNTGHTNAAGVMGFRVDPGTYFFEVPKMANE